MPSRKSNISAENKVKCDYYSENDHNWHII